jgi:hypothetical protein
MVRIVGLEVELQGVLEVARRITYEPGLALVISAGSLLFAYLAWRNTSRQEARRPQLVVEEVRLLEVKDVPDVLEEVEAIEEERRDDREDEERRMQGFTNEMERMMWEMNRSKHRGFGESYDGELPQKVLRVRLRNEGPVIAMGVEAIVYLEANHLEPLEYFADVEKVSYHPTENAPHGVYATRFGGSGLDLPPGLKYVDLFVAVLLHSPGHTEVASVLSTATTSVEDKKGLMIPATQQ